MKEMLRDNIRTITETRTDTIQRTISKDVLRDITKTIVEPVKQLPKFTFLPIVIKPSRPPVTPKKTPVVFIPSFKPKRIMPVGFGTFTVLGKRQGRFQAVGIGRTESEAFSIGMDWAKRTTGKVFKIPRARARKITGFKTIETPEGILYAEPKIKRRKR